MKIEKKNAKGNTTAQLTKAMKDANDKVTEAREKANNGIKEDISSILNEAANDCTCYDDLEYLSDNSTDEIDVWKCKWCECHHYIDKE